MLAFTPAVALRLRSSFGPTRSTLTHLHRRARLGSSASVGIMDAKAPESGLRTSATAMSITPESKCVACKGLGEAMSGAELDAHLPLVPEWSLDETRTELRRAFRTKNFATALDFLNRAGAVAEAENHHPDMGIKSWNEVHMAMSTHSLGGITTNDIIMAVKIDALPMDRRPLKKKKPASS